MAPKAAGPLLASLACWEAASRLLAGQLEEDSLDEVVQVASGWCGLLKKRMASTGKPSSTPLFVDLATTVSREMPAEGGPGQSPPTVLEKEVKVFRDPEEESQGVFLLRALTHLCRSLSGHPSCLILESCHLRLAILMPGGSKPLARPVVCFNPCTSSSERQSPSPRPDKPALRNFPSIKDAQVHILDMLQRVWLRQSSSVGAGGHVSIWVVLRRGEGSASLMEHVQNLRKKEKALAIVKRRQELERLAARMTAATDQPVRRRQQHRQDGDEDSMTAASPASSSRGGRDSARRSMPEDDDEAGHGAKEEVRPSGAMMAEPSELKLQEEEELGGRGRTPRTWEKEDGPLSARSAGGGPPRRRLVSPKHGSPYRPVVGKALPSPHRPAAAAAAAEDRPPRSTPPRPTPRAATPVVAAGIEALERPPVEQQQAAASPPPSARRSPAVSTAASPERPSTASSKRAADAAPPAAEQQQQVEVEQQEDAMGCCPELTSLLLQSVEAEDIQGLAARVYQTVKQQVLGAAGDQQQQDEEEEEPEEYSALSSLLQSVEAEDVQGLAARVYQAVKAQVLGMGHGPHGADEEEEEEQRVMRRSDSGVRYRGGQHEEQHSSQQAGRDHEEDERRAVGGGSGTAMQTAERRSPGRAEAVVGGQEGEEEGGRSVGSKRRARGMEELLESMDGEDIDSFGRRLYDVCKAMALRDTLLADRRQQGSDGPVLSSWDEGLRAGQRQQEEEEAVAVRRSVAVMERQGAAASECRRDSKEEPQAYRPPTGERHHSRPQQQDEDDDEEEEGMTHRSARSNTPHYHHQQQQQQEEEEVPRATATSRGGYDRQHVSAMEEDDVVLQDTVEALHHHHQMMPSSSYDDHQHLRMPDHEAAGRDEEEEDEEEDERSWRLREEEGREWSKGHDGGQRDEEEEDEDEEGLEGRSVGEQLAMEEGRAAEWDHVDRYHGQAEEEGVEGERRQPWGGRQQAQPWQQPMGHEEPTAPLPSPAHTNYDHQQQQDSRSPPQLASQVYARWDQPAVRGYVEEEGSSPLARSLQSGDFAGQVWHGEPSPAQGYAGNGGGQYWQQLGHGPSTGFAPHAYSPSAPLTQSLEVSGGAVWEPQQTPVTAMGGPMPSPQSAWPSVVPYIPLTPTAPSPPPPPPAAGLAPVPPAYIPPPRSPIVVVPAQQVQYDQLPSPSAPPPPPPVMNSSFLPPLTGDHRQQGQQQQLVLEWQVQRAREQIAMQEAAAEQRRQEQAMRVKMEALKAVLGIHPSSTTAPTQHPSTPQHGMTPRAAAAATTIHPPPPSSSCPTLPPAKGAVPVLGVRTGGAKPPARQHHSHHHHHHQRQHLQALPAAEPQLSARRPLQGEEVVVFEEEEEEEVEVVVVEETREKPAASRHHHKKQPPPPPQQQQHSHQPEPQQGEGKGRGQERRVPYLFAEEEGGRAAQPSSVTREEAEEEEEEQPGSRVMEWDVDGSQSPEERKRRQARLEAVRARKMKEAQEREEARRVRQHQQQNHRKLVEQQQQHQEAAERPSSSVGESPATAAAASSHTAMPAAAAGPERAPSARRSSSSSSSSHAGHGPSSNAAAVLGSTGARGVSNAKLIRNALQHVCLAGTIMATQRQKALEAMEAQPAGSNFVVLFNSSNALTFRGLYLLEGGGMGDASAVRKVFGSGPMFIKDDWVEYFYKYNSASRFFQPLEASKSFSVMTDGVTLDLSKLRRVAKDTIKGGR